jgi:RNA polymerase sigma-70 factor (ECF subfamily)
MKESGNQAPTRNAGVQVLIDENPGSLGKFSVNKIIHGIVGKAAHPHFQPSNRVAGELIFFCPMPNPSLADIFLQAGSLDLSLKSDALEEVLSGICKAVGETWSELEVDEPDFVAFLAEDKSIEDLSSIDNEKAADMFLARACGQGSSSAVQRFEDEYIRRIPAMLSHMKLSASMLDEVVQEVRMKLLVASKGQPPKIAGYAKRGKLDGLVQVVATRTAISMLRKNKPAAGEEELLKLPDPAYAPGLSYMKENYREAFGDCFELAVKGLSSRDRNLLRLHLLDKVTLEQLATMYSVHRATVVRWISKVREDLFARTRELLSKRLKIGSHEFESLMKLIESRLDLSVRRMLQSQESSTAAAPPE